MTEADLQLSGGVGSDGLGPVRTDDAIRRVIGFCADPLSSWGPYYLGGIAARAAGWMTTLGPWSLLWADTLNGRVSVSNLTAFTPDLRDEFARRVAAVPDNTDLAGTDPAETAAVIALCSFGYPGFWGPKSTKVSALYRPASVPVLDGHVAQAFGLPRTAFSSLTGGLGMNRQECIRQVVIALQSALISNAEALKSVRDHVEKVVPDLKHLSDLRLADIIIWTSPAEKLGARPWRPTERVTVPSLADYQAIPLIR